MTASQAAFEATVREDIGFGNHAGEAQRIFKGQCMQRSAETNTVRTLCSRCKHGQRIRRNRKLLEEMMINDGINVETGFVGVFDLTHDLPGLIVVRLAWRSLHLAVDPKTHCVS